jgi:hypothetical protein
MPSARRSRRRRACEEHGGCSTDAVVGGARASPRSAAIEGADTRQSARVDQLEAGKVHRHVEGDAVVGDAAFHAQAQRADLARRGAARIAPAAGVPLAPVGADTVRQTRRDERRLERTDQRPDRQAPACEGDDRIGHQLPRAVVGDLAAPLDADHLDVAPGKVVGRRQDVRRIRVPAERQDGRVLEEEQLVPDPARYAVAQRAASAARAPRDSRPGRASERRSVRPREPGPFVPERGGPLPPWHHSRTSLAGLSPGHVTALTERLGRLAERGR